MSKFDTDEQRVFKAFVQLSGEKIPYIEFGDTFTRFKDPITGKLFEVRLKEIRPKKKKDKL